MPPNREASIDAVTRHHKHSGVPIIMDPLKLKQVSAVRKQSVLETDLNQNTPIYINRLNGSTRIGSHMIMDS